MNFNIKTLGFTILLAIASSAMAAEQDPLARLDEALKASSAYQYGKDSGPLTRAEQVVVAAATDAKMRLEVEQRLLQALTAATTRDAKEFLCRQLLFVGTAKSIPQLEALLVDPELSHIARYTLGRYEDPAAMDALMRAMGKTTGKLQSGIIGTLGERRVMKALPAIAKLLNSPDEDVSNASASALGKMGGTDAVKALQNPIVKGLKNMQPINNALLMCADRYLLEGKENEATRLYEAFYTANQPQNLRIAGLRGLVAARGVKAIDLLVAAIQGNDPGLQASAIGFVRTMKGVGTTKTIAELLPKLAPDAQVLLLNALGVRGDASALPAVAAAVKSESEPVRTAACEALGSLGNASTVELLLNEAANAKGNEQQVARASLTQLKGDDANKALIRSLNAGDAKLKVEAIKSLARRRAVAANPELFKLAAGDDAAVRKEAIRALGSLAGQLDLSSMVALIANPKDAGDRGGIEQAIESVCRRITDREQQAAPILAALSNAPVDAKLALIRLLAIPATPKALDAVRAALKDANAQVKESAMRTLADWPDAKPAEELLALAKTEPNETLKVVALRGYVRMAGLSKDSSAMYLRAMELAERNEDKKLVLAGLGTSSSTEALKLVQKYVDNEALSAEACLAAVQIADKSRQSDATSAKSAIQQVIASAKDVKVRQKAQDVLNDMEKFQGFILNWFGSGPYEEKGKDASVLINLALAPEQADAKDVQWKKITRGIGSWEITLDDAMGGGNDRAGYARTRVWSPAEQDVRLELTSDDGIKVWLNGAMVHNKYVNRGMEPRQDLVKAKLKEGWNELMLKIVNRDGGWGLACRIRKPDGSALDGMKIEAQ